MRREPFCKNQGRVEARHDFCGRNAAAHRLPAAEQAHRCIKWLEAQGFEVLFAFNAQHVPFLPSCALPPRIYIRPCALCDKIEGAVARYERGPRGERRYKMAQRMGCEVRWADEGGAA